MSTVSLPLGLYTCLCSFCLEYSLPESLWLSTPDSVLSSQVTSFGPHPTPLFPTLFICFISSLEFCHHLKLHVLYKMKTPRGHMSLVPCPFAGAGKEGREIWRGGGREGGREGKRDGHSPIRNRSPSRYQICTLTLPSASSPSCLLWRLQVQGPSCLHPQSEHLQRPFFPRDLPGRTPAGPYSPLPRVNSLSHSSAISLSPRFYFCGWLFCFHFYFLNIKPRTNYS